VAYEDLLRGFYQRLEDKGEKDDAQAPNYCNHLRDVHDLASGVSEDSNCPNSFTNADTFAKPHINVNAQANTDSKANTNSQTNAHTELDTSPRSGTPTTRCWTGEGAMTWSVDRIAAGLGMHGMTVAHRRDV
jgi:hypothetical protein